MRLGLNDCTSGANVGAGAAAGTFVSVDFVDVAFRDSSDGAFIDTGTASSANISDFVSHFNNIFKVNN